MNPVSVTHPEVLVQAEPGERDACLQAHLRTTESVRETTASGLSVLRGWIELMAEGSLTEDEQEHAVAAARRRTDAIQTAVDRLIRTSTVSLRGGRRVEIVDLAAVWDRTIGGGLLSDDEQPMLIETHLDELEAFLSAAAPILVPETIVIGESIALPVVDAGSLSAAARSALTTSRGALAQSPAGACAAWKQAGRPDLVNSAHDGRK